MANFMKKFTGGLAAAATPRSIPTDSIPANFCADGEMAQLRDLMENKDFDAATQLMNETEPEKLQKMLKCTDAQGHTALYAAIWHKAPESLLIKLIEECDNSVFHAKNKYGWTPLHAATERGAKYTVIQMLIRRNPGALDEKNSGGETPKARFGCLDDESMELVHKETSVVLMEQLPATEAECAALRRQIEELKSAAAAE